MAAGTQVTHCSTPPSGGQQHARGRPRSRSCHDDPGPGPGAPVKDWGAEVATLRRALAEERLARGAGEGALHQALCHIEEDGCASRELLRAEVEAVTAMQATIEVRLLHLEEQAAREVPMNAAMLAQEEVARCASQACEVICNRMEQAFNRELEQKQVALRLWAEHRVAESEQRSTQRDGELEELRRLCSEAKGASNEATSQDAMDRSSAMQVVQDAVDRLTSAMEMQVKRQQGWLEELSVEVTQLKAEQPHRRLEELSGEMAQLKAEQPQRRAEIDAKQELFFKQCTEVEGAVRLLGDQMAVILSRFASDAPAAPTAPAAAPTVWETLIYRPEPPDSAREAMQEGQQSTMLLLPPGSQAPAEPLEGFDSAPASDRLGRIREAAAAGLARASPRQIGATPLRQTSQPAPDMLTQRGHATAGVHRSVSHAGHHPGSVQAPAVAPGTLSPVCVPQSAGWSSGSPATGGSVPVHPARSRSTMAQSPRGGRPGAHSPAPPGHMRQGNGYSSPAAGPTPLPPMSLVGGMPARGSVTAPALVAVPPHLAGQGPLVPRRTTGPALSAVAAQATALQGGQAASG
eukprot:CAMPEP_0195089854 /NCGR_PEP_ID=MMETSP0448-20130528/29030_1 /TAXON_ID=66468 /ORGANISM="Heterocapsa triquestra, Strain CCMP 448" /LENGTH=575 /DNA_ID=CAMNT_0040123629 /DNA_START=17 /DNA_END=1740 /DNA_ORIENTATION=-